MFEIKVNDYWIRALIISKYSEKFFMERLFDAISEFDFKEKYVYKTSYDNSNNLYNTAVIFLIGEKNKKILNHKYRKLKVLCSDVTLSPYTISQYPLPNELKELPYPNWILDGSLVKNMEDYEFSHE